MAYNNWIACVNEHLVRVNVARFALQLKDEEAKDEILKSEYDKGFRYIYELDEVMNVYEQNRETYNSYQDYYFEILDCFGKINN